MDFDNSPSIEKSTKDAAKDILSFIRIGSCEDLNASEMAVKICEHFWNYNYSKRFSEIEETLAISHYSNYRDINRYIETSGITEPLQKLFIFYIGLSNSVADPLWYHYNIFDVIDAYPCERLKIYSALHLLSIKDVYSKSIGLRSAYSLSEAFEKVSSYDSTRNFLIALKNANSPVRVQGLKNPEKLKSLKLSKIFPMYHRYSIESANVEIKKLEESNVEKLITITSESIPLTQKSCEHYIFNHRTDESEAPDVSVYTLENCYVSYDFRYPSQPQIYIFDQHRCLIEDFCIGYNPFLQSNDDIEDFHKTVAYIDDRFCKFNICHFVFDKLTRLKLIKSVSEELNHVLLCNQNNYTKDFLQMLGVIAVELSNGKRGTLHLDKMLVCDNSFEKLRHPIHRASTWAVDALRETIKDIPSLSERKQNRKLYVSRQATRRKVKNFDEVKDLLCSKGYDIVDPSGTSLHDQIELFQSCVSLVGVHGAGLTNLAFMRQNSKVIELLPPLCATLSYYLPATALGHRYHPFLCKDAEGLEVSSYENWKHNSKHNRRDVLVDCRALSELL